MESRCEGAVRAQEGPHWEDDQTHEMVSYDSSRTGHMRPVALVEREPRTLTMKLEKGKLSKATAAEEEMDKTSTHLTRATAGFHCSFFITFAYTFECAFCTNFCSGSSSSSLVCPPGGGQDRHQVESAESTRWFLLIHPLLQISAHSALPLTSGRTLTLGIFVFLSYHLLA